MMDKIAFKWDPTYYVKASLPLSGCFGCLNGHLMLGEKHHQLIMAALIKKGWTFGQMIKQHQAWGWYSVVRPETLLSDSWLKSQLENDPYTQEQYLYHGLPKGHRAQYWPFLSLQFSSDAGVMDEIGVRQCQQAFQTMYRLPVQIGQTESFGGLQNEENYGKGLAGPQNINRYLDENSEYYHYTDNIRNVPDAPESEPWNDEQAARLEYLQEKQKRSMEPAIWPNSPISLTKPEENELLQLWIAQQEHQMQVQARYGKIASQQYKFVWADGIFEVSKGFLKDLHHFSLLSNIVGKLGHEPINYVAGDFTQDPFHPQYGSLTIRWHQGQSPSPADLKDMMQRYVTHLSV